MADFKQLLVWQRAHALSIRISLTSRQIRGAHHLSLRSQMVRAAQSVPANIVEGRDQPSDRAFSKFLRIALNSANELESHLITARDLRAIPKADFDAITSELQEVQRMLHGFVRRLKDGT
ncbi:MAG: four helix bundle protein [Phycisphaerae bacterium]|nr:four helix bundle protein [Gemmatimonadaceae bacterium]